MNKSKIIHFENRITGEEADYIESPSLLGEWLLRTNETELQLNDAFITDFQFVVPDEEGYWSLTTENNVLLQKGIFGEHQIIPDGEISSLIALGELLGNANANNWNYDEWLNISPLVPKLGEKVKIQKLEISIDKYFPFLEEVCHNPSAQLHDEIELVHVSRARRIPRKAISYLSAHTEDWEKRTVYSVIPKRIKSRIRQEDFNIYENRVAVRLIDNLSSYLWERILEVKGILNSIFKKVMENESHEGVFSGYHRKIDRMYEILGDAVSDIDQVSATAGNTVKTLERLFYRVQALKNTPLYKVIPSSAGVSHKLYMTNIFASHTHYRNVGILWNEWLINKLESAKTPQQLFSDYQSMCDGFNLYSILLIMRSLSQLDYIPPQNYNNTQISHDDDNTIIEFEGKHNNALLRIDKFSRVTVKNTRSGRSFRFIPVASPLMSFEDDNDLRTILQNISENLDDTGSYNVLLYPCTEHIKAEKSVSLDRINLHTIENDIAYSKRIGIGILPVSPWEIESMERVCRAVRWVLNEDCFDNYPPVIGGKAPDILIKNNPDWIKEIPNKQIYKIFVDPPDRAGVINKISNHIQEKLKLAEAIQVHLNTSKKGGKSRGAKKQELNELKKEIERIKIFQEEFNRALQYIDYYKECPLCGHPVTIYEFEKRDKDTFYCECIDCKAGWGLWVCGNCSKRYPVIVPKIGHINDKKKEANGWSDGVFGSDILSVPNKQYSYNDPSFICPHCGE